MIKNKINLKFYKSERNSVNQEKKIKKTFGNPGYTLIPNVRRFNFYIEKKKNKIN